MLGPIVQNARALPTAEIRNAGVACDAGYHAKRLQSITFMEPQAVRDTLIGLTAYTRLQNSANEELASI